ncbi:MAG: hypothetical protein ACK56I_16945, partial [bacterium]
VNDLRHAGQAAEEGPKARVVEAWSAVEQQQGGLLAELRTVVHPAQALDIDKKADAGFNLNAHALVPFMAASRTAMISARNPS